MTRFAISLVAGVSALAIASAAQAADLIIEQPAVGVVETTSGGWEGAFVGVFAGYGWGTATQAITDDVFDGDELDLSGWLVGADFGYNFYLSDGIVAGVVADIAWSDIGGEDTGYDTTVGIDWAGSVRGRLGFDGGAFMPYITGGLAMAGATADYSGDSDSNVHVGWTAGAGVEIAATEDLSIDLQYRYSDYGTQTYEIVPDADLSLTNHQVTAGLHWNF
ncbi:outer membrane protein [Devosia sp.]|uniref:outer membrane protein n=1 Tax=Devosia sp. TaxID=1871048 RepID=UPI002F10ECA7